MKAYEKAINGVQYFADHWRGKRRAFRFTGECLACGRRTFGFEDGENDPRGYLGDNTVSLLCSHDDDRIAGEHPLCALCANEEGPYRAGVRKAIELSSHAKPKRITRPLKLAPSLPTIRSFWTETEEEGNAESGPSGKLSVLPYCVDCYSPEWKGRAVDLKRGTGEGEPVVCAGCHAFLGVAP